MDALVYVSIAVIIIILLLLVGLLTRTKWPFSQETAVQNENEEARPVARPGVRNVEPLAAGARRRPVRRRMRTTALADDDSGSEAEEGDVFDDIAQPEGKIGTKKLRKLQEKAERKSMREQDERDRTERKEREVELEEIRKKEEQRKDVEEAEKQEEQRKHKEEEEKQAYEEYLKLKEMFTVEEEGEQGENPDLESQSLLQEFIDYIKTMKVIMLEDLANHFKIKTPDAINRVQELIAEGRLTGVLDDRGKFIYITMEELESVAKFIRQHGRVSITELAESSNRLINLTPDNAETVEKLYTEVA